MTAIETIRHLYFNATKSTIQRDLAQAIDLLKGMQNEQEREKATVYMEGLAQMRSEWANERYASGETPRKPKPGKPDPRKR